MNGLNISEAALKYIAFQRTDSLRFRKIPGYGLLKKLAPASVYRLGVTLESRLCGDRIRDFYARDMESEFRSIADHVPVRCDSILDIGCGVAGIDRYLYAHYGKTAPTIYLLDKTATDESVFYGFEQRGAFYNSLEIARDFLITNGVPQDRLHLLEATENNAINISGSVDLIVSLISWGFHYPVMAYLDRAVELMHDESVLILDVRKNTGGMEVMRTRFAHVEIIDENAKSSRVVARKR